MEMLSEDDIERSTIDPNSITNGQPPHKPGFRQPDMSADHDPQPAAGAAQTDPTGDQSYQSSQPNDDMDDTTADPMELDTDESKRPPKEVASLLARVSNHPFAADYDSSNDAKYSPNNIASLDNDELHDLRDKVEQKMKSIEMTKRHGLFSDRSYVYLQSMTSFIQKILSATEN
jgi:hypothetical protein